MGNVDLFRKIIEQGFNRGSLAVADEICSPDMVEHGCPVLTKGRGPEVLKAQIKKARDEVVDLCITIEDLVVSGDKVWARSHAFGKSRLGEEVAYTVFDVCRFKDGKIVEHWGVSDRFALPQSEVPPPQRNVRRASILSVPVVADRS